MKRRNPVIVANPLPLAYLASKIKRMRRLQASIKAEARRARRERERVKNLNTR